MNKNTKGIYIIIAIVVLVIILILVNRGNGNVSEGEYKDDDFADYIGDTWTSNKESKEQRDGLHEGVMYSLDLANDTGVDVLSVADYYRTILVDNEGPLYREVFSGTDDFSRAYSYETEIEGGYKKIIDISVKMNETNPEGCDVAEGEAAKTDCVESTGGKVNIFVSDKYKPE